MAMPSESKADKQERKRQRRISELERARAAQENAYSLTTDLQAVYGTARPGVSLFRMAK